MLTGNRNKLPASKLRFRLALGLKSEFRAHHNDILTKCEIIDDAVIEDENNLKLIYNTYMSVNSIKHLSWTGIFKNCI
jgi:hypothetical protein